MAQAGAIAFKTYFIQPYDTRSVNFSNMWVENDAQLMDTWEHVAKTGLVGSAHCENQVLIDRLAAQLQAEGKNDPQSVNSSRPPIVEIEAISRAIMIARAAGSRLHIVHLTTAGALQAVARAKSEGQDVTCEVTPPHLFFTSDVIAKDGPYALHVPPLREASDVEALWNGLHDRSADYIATDHAAFNDPSVKEIGWTNAWQVKCGDALIESMLPLLLTEVNAGRFTLLDLAEWCSAAPARIHRLYPRKGVLQVGSDADLTVVDLDQRVPPRRQQVLQPRRPQRPPLRRPPLQRPPHHDRSPRPPRHARRPDGSLPRLGHLAKTHPTPKPLTHSLEGRQTSSGISTLGVRNTISLNRSKPPYGGHPRRRPSANRGYVLPQQRPGQVIEHGAVAIQGNKIVDVGPADRLQATTRAVRTIDCTGRLVMPGLVDCHVHTCQSTARGLADDVPVSEWLDRIVGFEAFMDEQDVVASVQLACLEMIKSGTTGYIEACLNPLYVDAAAEVVASSGLRCALTRSNMQQKEPTWDAPDDFLEGADTSLQATRDMIKRWNGAANGRISAWSGWRHAQDLSDEMLLDLVKLMDEYGVGLHAHLGTREYGEVDRLDRLGALRSGMVFAHGIRFTAREIELLKLTTSRSTTTPCQPPRLLRRLPSRSVSRDARQGHLRLPRLDAGANNNTLDMFRTMYLAATIHKDARGDATIIPAPVALQMGTTNGARACGWSDVGVLAPATRPIC